MKRFLYLIPFTFLISGAVSKAPKEEFRGVWIATVANIDWPKHPSDDAEKKKKLIGLTLKIYGDTITESKQKEIKQYKITAKDIKIIVDKANIELMAENISF